MRYIVVSLLSGIVGWCLADIRKSRSHKEISPITFVEPIYHPTMIKPPSQVENGVIVTRYYRRPPNIYQVMRALGVLDFHRKYGRFGTMSKYKNETTHHHLHRRRRNRR